MREDKGCFEITVEDPSDEFLSMRDVFDIKMILNNGHFSCFKDLVKGGASFGKKITKETYHNYKLQRTEVDEIAKKLKLTRVEVK